ncbi:MAG: hypothetical protein AAFR97_10360 [Bacteroidota bacterium]
MRRPKSKGGNAQEGRRYEYRWNKAMFAPQQRQVLKRYEHRIFGPDFRLHASKNGIFIMLQGTIAPAA